MTAESPVIRAARIEREPLVLGARARAPARAPAPASASASAPIVLEPLPRVPAASTASAAPVRTGAGDTRRENAGPVVSSSQALSPPVDEALRLAEQDRVLREELTAERARVLERAREQGHRAGVEQGRAELEEKLGNVRQLIASMHAALADGIAGSEEVIVEIAFEAVAKMLGESLAGREGVQAAVRQVLRGVRDREPLIVRVSPRDHALLDGAGVLPRADSHRIELLADERVELGGCLVEAGGGTIDGRLETQLQRLRDTLVAASRMQPTEAGA